ncbi:hypothetical protein [Rhizobium leguminosarum]|uniref:hypothetical protein n=1 Tax=Rhizobium leguminosarum TaxID=384 RepID=UPI001C978F60|nr:hypothetical protein [Rhizobium leguminosarum]MBY5821503.1 hypothetical protein [Rhizobium leguminosarum]
MTMVERCAKAIYEKRNGIGCTPWSQQKKVHRAPYLDDAKAAIREIRENTPAMSEAMRIANMNIAGGYGGPSGWEAAIDTALKEQEGEKG